MNVFSNIQLEVTKSKKLKFESHKINNFLIVPWYILHSLGSHFGWDQYGPQQEENCQEGSKEEHETGHGGEGGQERGGGGL